MIVNDAAQLKLDKARAAYRRQYDRGFLLSQKGRDEEGQRILDRANAALQRAQDEYIAARR